MISQLKIHPLCGYPFYGYNVNAPVSSAEDAAIRAEAAATRAEAAADRILNMDINIVGTYNSANQMLALSIEKEV